MMLLNIPKRCPEVTLAGSHTCEKVLDEAIRKVLDNKKDWYHSETVWLSRMKDTRIRSAYADYYLGVFLKCEECQIDLCVTDTDFFQLTQTILIVARLFQENPKDIDSPWRWLTHSDNERNLTEWIRINLKKLQDLDEIASYKRKI